jgi:hypothetical protein
MFTSRPPALGAAAAQQRLDRIRARSGSPGRLPPLAFDVRLVGNAMLPRGSSSRGWEL